MPVIFEIPSTLCGKKFTWHEIFVILWLKQWPLGNLDIGTSVLAMTSHFFLFLPCDSFLLKKLEQ